MRVLRGQSISPGYASGIANVVNLGDRVELTKYPISAAEIDSEIQRFQQAVESSENELKGIEHHVLAELGGMYSSIFSSHLSLLRDRQFIDQVRRRISESLINAEQAVELQVTELMRLIGSLENDYLRERANDIRDLGNRLIRQLDGNAMTRLRKLEPRSIIVVHELLPSETIDLDREHVEGIVTEQGGDNSHAAILARALGIPAVTGVVEATSRIKAGSRLLVDGTSGCVTIDPTNEAIAGLAALKSDYDDIGATAASAECLDCITRDGVKVSLLANLNREEEIELVNAHQLEGVGLFRTEFLYIDSPVAPSFDRQRDLYRRLIDGLCGRKLVVRTLDLGGDKLPRFMRTHYEANPNLGSRGLRFSLSEPELFSTQLRALLSAAVHGDLRIIFPMVVGESDFCRACRQVEQLSGELGLNSLPRLGAMIETPAALFALKEILQQADFVSIGTNDLTQYMLATDRDAADMADDYSVLHPSVLRAIRRVVTTADEAGCELSVCGEAAGEIGTACVLIGLGVRQLSMSPIRAVRVKLGIRNLAASELRELAEQALQADSVLSVKQLVREFQQGKPELSLSS